MKQLRPYQQEANDSIAEHYGNGFRRLIFQLPTGGGKTITAADLIRRFAEAMPAKKILFVVHREELLQQFREAIYKQYGIIAEPIVAGAKYRTPTSQVYVTMVETANNRLRTSKNWFGDVGLMVIDEAHLGNFKKLHDYFPNALIVGLTATPLSASKKHPLRDIYEEIVTSTDIPALIKMGALVPNKTFHIKGQVSRESLLIKNGEFDARNMFEEFSKSKHIQNCVKGYEDHAKGMKTIVFNCNVEHSKMVNDAFLAAGYESRHLDGMMEESERKATLKWFAETPNAILNNIGILTAGFDEPSVQCVVMNRATLSLPLWIQCTGRGSRPFPGKDSFTIIDMGGNALQHGDWSTPRNWRDLFHNPPKPGKKKDAYTAPVKMCNDCEAIMNATAFTCPECGAEQPRPKPAYDRSSVEFELLNDSLNMDNLIQHTQQLGYNKYRSLHQAKEIIVSTAKQQNTGMDHRIAHNLLDIYQVKVKDWCRMNGKRHDQWHKETTAKWLFEEIEKQFGFDASVPETKFRTVIL